MMATQQEDFFGDFEASAKITGFNVQLLKRFAVILKAMASGREIDVERFRRYSKDTARLYVDLYPWNYMPATVHNRIFEKRKRKKCLLKQTAY